ncbi:MAG TPA: hypothetical protein VLC52_07890 [Anaerolineae bacterium]|nr:hypothetical protein [Anaerolineae bacterium]
MPAAAAGVTATAWLRARARMLPGSLAQSPPWVRDVFDHAWAPMTSLARQLAPLPAGLWPHLLGCEGGYLAVCNGPSRYEPGPARLRGRQVTNVAYVSIQDLAQENEQPLHVAGHLVDHHLGNGGAAEGAWLSEGGGLCPRWREAGERLARVFALGYGIDAVARSSLRDYFAQSLALYCRERQRLNVADPQVHKWLRTTLWDESFWQAEG